MNHYDSEMHGTIGYVESSDMPPMWGKTPMTGLYRKPIVKTIKLSIFQFNKENNTHWELLLFSTVDGL